MTHLYLREDLFKALPKNEPPNPTASPKLSLPKVGGQGGAASAGPSGTPEGMQPCSVGGGDACLQAGGNGAEYHKLGGAIEQKHAQHRASQGAGASQEATTAPATEMSTEETQQKLTEAGPSMVAVQGKEGVTSTDPANYPETSQPGDHYKVAEAVEVQGKGSDSAKKVAQGHRDIARQRAEGHGPEEHEELAQQLHEQGLADDAAHHEKQAKQGRAVEEESAEVDPDTEAPAEEIDPTQAHEDEKARIDEEHTQAMTAHAESEKAHREHSEKLSAHEEKMREHERNAPEEPEPFTDQPPEIGDHEGREEAFSTAKKAHLKKKKEHAKKMGEHKKAKHAHKQAGKKLKDAHADLKAKAPDKPGKPPKHPGYPDAPEQEDVPRPPSNDLEHAQVADHAEKASSAFANIQAHLEALADDMNLTPEQQEATRKKLERIKSSLHSHAQQKHVPSSEQAAELKELLKLAGEHGKNPPEPTQLAEGEDEAQADPKKKKLNLASTFESGRRFGTSLGHAAAAGPEAGAIGSDVLNYGASGVVHGGQHLLNAEKQQRSKVDEQASQAEARAQLANTEAKKQQKTLGEEVASERTEKSMSGLYLDLSKAVQMPNAGGVTEDEKTAQRRVKTSYAKHPVGVMGGAGIAMPDDPDVGRQWKHSPEDSVAEEVEEERDASAAAKKEKDEETAKAFGVLADLHKALDSVKPKYNLRELEFMQEVLGASPDDIRKGLVRIVGRDRHKFHEWLLGRLDQNITTLTGGLVG